MAVKLDLSGVKSFFFEKGEKVGMFACAAVALVLIGYGMMGGMGRTPAAMPVASKARCRQFRRNWTSALPTSTDGSREDTTKPRTMAARHVRFPARQFLPDARHRQLQAP